MPARADVRPLAAADLPAAVPIVADSAWNADALARFCGESMAGSAEHLGLLAERTGEPLGVLLLTRVLDEAEIINLAISAGERRRGFGRLLLRAGLDVLRSRGVSRCHLEVRAGNAAAIGLYRGEGFIDNGRRSNYYRSSDGAVEDALTLILQLSESRA